MAKRKPLKKKKAPKKIFGMDVKQRNELREIHDRWEAAEHEMECAESRQVQAEKEYTELCAKAFGVEVGDYIAWPVDRRFSHVYVVTGFSVDMYSPDSVKDWYIHGQQLKENRRPTNRRNEEKIPGYVPKRPWKKIAKKDFDKYYRPTKKKKKVPAL